MSVHKRLLPILDILTANAWKCASDQLNRECSYGTTDYLELVFSFFVEKRKENENKQKQVATEKCKEGTKVRESGEEKCAHVGE